jgi:hypothetical protein
VKEEVNRHSDSSRPHPPPHVKLERSENQRGSVTRSRSRSPGRSPGGRYQNHAPASHPRGSRNHHNLGVVVAPEVNRGYRALFTPVDDTGIASLSSDNNQDDVKPDIDHSRPDTPPENPLLMTPISLAGDTFPDTSLAPFTFDIPQQNRAHTCVLQGPIDPRTGLPARSRYRSTISPGMQTTVAAPPSREPVAPTT